VMYFYDLQNSGHLVWETLKFTQFDDPKSSYSS
jgi:hypothetical protein